MILLIASIFFLAIVLSVLLRFTDSDYLSVVFKPFFALNNNYSVSIKSKLDFDLKFKTNEKQNKMAILFRPFDLLAPKDLNYVAFQSLDFERT